MKLKFQYILLGILKKVWSWRESKKRPPRDTRRRRPPGGAREGFRLTANYDMVPRTGGCLYAPARGALFFRGFRLFFAIFRVLTGAGKC